MVLQRYLTRLLLAYARRYIRGLSSELRLPLWGGDLVLADLDLRLDALHAALAMPKHMTFSRGFVKEMRVHIPWTALTSRPVEVTLTGVECAIQCSSVADTGQAGDGGEDVDDTASDNGEDASGMPHASPSTSRRPAPELDPDEAAEVGGSGWAADLIAKIVANLTLRIQGLSFTFVEEMKQEEAPERRHTRPGHVPASPPRPPPPPRQILLSLRVSQLLLQSTNSAYAVQFTELTGPWKLVHKSLELQQMSIHLGELPPDHSSRDGPLPLPLHLSDDTAILRDLSISVHIRTYLAALGGPSLIRLPYAADGPPPPSGAALSLAVRLHRAAEFFLSDQQLQFLVHIAESTAAASARRRAQRHSMQLGPAALRPPDLNSLAVVQQLDASLASTASLPASSASRSHSPPLVEVTPTATEPGLGSPPLNIPMPPPLAGTRARSSSLPTVPSSQSAPGWRSWMWALVSEDTPDAAPSFARSPAAEFYVAYGHLAPQEVVELQVHVPRIAVQLLQTVQVKKRFDYTAASGAEDASPAARRTSDPLGSSTRRSSVTQLIPFASLQLASLDVTAAQQLHLPSLSAHARDEDEERMLDLQIAKRTTANVRFEVRIARLAVELHAHAHHHQQTTSSSHATSGLRASTELIRFVLADISCAHRVSSRSAVRARASNPNARSASTESQSAALAGLTHTTLIKGALRIAQIKLTHVAQAVEHELWVWDASSAAVSPHVTNGSPAPHPPVSAHWTSSDLDVEVCGFQLFVPLLLVKLVMQAATMVQPPSTTQPSVPPKPTAAAAGATSRTPRPYRSNAQSMKIVVHSSSVSIGTGVRAAEADTLVCAQWQSIFVIAAATNCDARWQHAVFSDTLECRLVDFAVSVGKQPVVSGATPPTTSLDCSPPPTSSPLVLLAPVTCVLQLTQRAHVLTTDITVSSLFLSLPAMLTASPPHVFVPFYHSTQVSTHVQEVTVTLEPDQITMLMLLVAQLTPPPQRHSSRKSATPATSPAIDSAPSMPAAPPDPVSHPLTHDDFRSMRPITSSLGPPPQVALLRPRAGHLSFIDEALSRRLTWRYASPRAITRISVHPPASASGVERPTGAVFLYGALSAWDSLQQRFVHVFDLLVSLHDEQSAPLPATLIVAEEWRLEWSVPTPSQAREWSRGAGRYRRWVEMLQQQQSFDTPIAPMPFAAELAALLRVESRLFCQHGTNVRVDLTLPHASFVLNDRVGTSSETRQLAACHVQHVRARSDMWLRHPLDDTLSLSRVGSATTVHLSAEALWLNLVEWRDLTHFAVVRPVPLSVVARQNDLARMVVGATASSTTAGAQHNSFLPVSLLDHRERGWDVAMEVGPARLICNQKVLLTCMLIAQRLQQCMGLPSPPPPSSRAAAEHEGASKRPIHATSAYVLVNRSGIDLRYGQVGTRESMLLSAGTEQAYSWQSLAPSLAHPLHAPPDVPNPFTSDMASSSLSSASSDLVEENDARLRYHWMRVSTAESHAWSQALLIDVPASAAPRVDFSNLQQIGKVRDEGAAGSTQLSHVLLYRMHDAGDEPSRDGGGGGVGVGVSAPAVESMVLFVSVERRGLNTFVTFLPAHSIVNELPVGLLADMVTETHTQVHATTSSPRQMHSSMSLASHSTQPLSLWYPYEPTAVVDGRASPPPTTIQKSFKLLLASTAAADASAPAALSGTPAWSEVLSLPLDTITSHFSPAHLAPPLMDAGAGRCRLSILQHKQHPSRRMYLYVQIVESAHTAGPATTPSAPSVLRPVRFVLSPAFLVHNPLTRPLSVHLGRSRAPVKVVLEQGEALAPGETRALVHVDPSAAQVMTVALPATEQTLGGGVATDDSAAVPAVDPSLLALSSVMDLPVSSSVAALPSGPLQRSLVLEGIGSAREGQPDSKAHLYVSVSNTERAPAQKMRMGLPLLNSNSPTLCISFAAPFLVHNLCSDPAWLRGAMHDHMGGGAPSTLIAPLSHAGIDVLAWSVADMQELSVGVHADSSMPESLVYWSRPLKTHVPVRPSASRSRGAEPESAAPSLSSSSSSSFDRDVDILAVANVEPAGSRPLVMLHQLVVTVAREGVGALPHHERVVSSEECGSVAAARSSSSSSSDSFPVTHIWIKPRFVLHNRCRVPLHFVQEGILSSAPINELQPPSLAPGAAKAMEAWNVTCAPTGRQYDAGAVGGNDFSPLLSLSLPASLSSSSSSRPSNSASVSQLAGPADDDDEWSWSPNLNLDSHSPGNRPPPVHRVRVVNNQRGFERMLAYTVLTHRRVRHVIVWHEDQPPCLVLNRSDTGIEVAEFQEEGEEGWRGATNRGTTGAGGVVVTVAAGECSELEIPGRTPSSSMPGDGADDEEGSGSGSDDDDASQTPRSASRRLHGWHGEGRLFDAETIRRRLTFRLGAADRARLAGKKGSSSAWSSSIPLRPGEYALRLPRPVPGSPAAGHFAAPPSPSQQQQQFIHARVAIAIHKGSILIVIDASNQQQRSAEAHVPPALVGAAPAAPALAAPPPPLPPMSFGVKLAIASLTVALHDDRYASITCNEEAGNDRAARRLTPGAPSGSAAGGGGGGGGRDGAQSSSSPGVRPRLDSLGELLLVLTLDRVQLHVRQTTEQPLHLLVPLVAASPLSPGPRPRGGLLTPPSPSVLPQEYTVVELDIREAQLDNQMEEAELPVVMYSCSPSSSSSSSSQANGTASSPSSSHLPAPAFRCVYVASVPLHLASRVVDDGCVLSSPSLLRGSSPPDTLLCSLALQPLVLQVEDQLVLRMLDVGMDLAQQTSRGVQTTIQLPYDIHDMSAGPHGHRTGRPSRSRGSVAAAHSTTDLDLDAVAAARIDSLVHPPLFAHYVSLSSLDVRVTVRAGAHPQHSSGLGVVGSLPMFLGAEHMPLSLAAVRLRCVQGSPARIVRELGLLYGKSALARSPLLLGSLSLLGNPTFLLRSVSQGLGDLVSMPRRALREGHGFVGALGGGVKSLIRHTTEGTLTSVTGFSQAVARNMERLGSTVQEQDQGSQGQGQGHGRGGSSPQKKKPLDRSRSTHHHQRHPTSVGGGLASGVRSLGSGVLGGLVGVVSHPLAGASSGGLEGFLRGVGSGLLGAVSGPVGGVAELVAATSQGLAQVSGVDSTHTQRGRRREEEEEADSSSSGSSGGSSTSTSLTCRTTAHSYHRFSPLKFHRMCSLLGESYVAHALVSFAPLPVSGPPHTQPPPVYSPSSGPLDLLHEYAGGPLLGLGSTFALLLVTSRGVRIAREDTITHSFNWGEVRVEAVRSNESPPLILHSGVTKPQGSRPPSSARKLADAYLDQRALIEWLHSEQQVGAAASAESSSPDPPAARPPTNPANLKLPFDILLLHPQGGMPTIALWIPRMIRAVLMNMCYQAQKAAANTPAAPPMRR